MKSKNEIPEDEIPEIIERLQTEGCLCLVNKKQWDGKGRIHICCNDEKTARIIAAMVGAKEIEDKFKEGISFEAEVSFGIRYDFPDE